MRIAMLYNTTVEPQSTEKGRFLNNRGGGVVCLQAKHLTSKYGFIKV